MADIDYFAMAKTCPVCKQKFYISSFEWRYKAYTDKGTKYVCSYGCMRQYQKEHPSPKKQTSKTIYT